MLDRILSFSDCWILVNLWFWDCPFPFRLWFFFYRSHHWWLKLVGVIGSRSVDFFFRNASSLAVALYFLEKLFFLASYFRDTLFLCLYGGHILFINVFLLRVIVNRVVWVPFFAFDKVIFNVDDFRLLVFIIRIWL